MYAQFSQEKWNIDRRRNPSQILNLQFPCIFFIKKIKILKCIRYGKILD